MPKLCEVTVFSAILLITEPDFLVSPRCILETLRSIHLLQGHFYSSFTLVQIS